ncbi:MAG: DUF1987 domain-containing protein [Bacteroidales bacterium]|nr:DUF1987 domain-containing protein [Bacteroidales bacterium]
MKDLFLPETKFTPKVNLSVENCTFEIIGSSYSDNIYEKVYEKVIKWVEEEMPKIECDMNCVFSINILNSMSYKNIMQIMIQFVEYRKAGKNISITWYFEGDDEDNEELAEDLSGIFDIPFTIKSI